MKGTLSELEFAKYRVFTRNEREARLLIQEIFDGHAYRMNPTSQPQVIVDCGSHIGLSVLYFKMISPASRITAIEANPENFELLRKNVEVNGLADVTLVQGAL